jgi:hypothetical protein
LLGYKAKPCFKKKKKQTSSPNHITRKKKRRMFKSGGISPKMKADLRGRQGLPNTEASNVSLVSIPLNQPDTEVKEKKIKVK